MLDPLFQDLSVHLTPGWWGVVGANGSGKSTLLKLAAGMLTPEKGTIGRPDLTVYCPQRTDDPPDHLAAFLKDAGKTAAMLKGKLGIGPNWPHHWSCLSHGERKRAQIAVSQWQMPDVLAIDEPTNHVDAHGRKLLMETLLAFKGIGLIVSHDRELLDQLCTHCLFMEPPDIAIRPGGYSKGRQLAQAENQAAQRSYAAQKRTVQKIRREAGKRRDLANSADRRRSKKGLAKHDADAKSKIDLVRLSGKDATGGKLTRQMDKQLQRAENKLGQIHVKKEFGTGIWIPGSLSKRNLLLNLPAGELALGENMTLSHPELSIRPTDRIALTGANGTGKSTLLRKIIPALNVPFENLTYIPQEIDQALSENVLRQVQEMPEDKKGNLMTIVSCLGSRPARLLQSQTPSPGEIRKLLLALGMSREPHIILMDEPTNHMDLPSIECLEKALSDYPGALFLISHDRHFLSALTDQHWQIAPEAEKRFCLETA